MPSTRPKNFRLNKRHPYAQGLVFAGLGGADAYSGTLNDYSPYRNNATLTNMTPSTDWVWSSELGRSALDFDGASSGVNAGSGPVSRIENTERMTAAAWVYQESLSASDGAIIASFVGTGDDAWMLWYDVDGAGVGYAALVQGEAGGYHLAGTDEATAVSGVWQHVLMSYDGSKLILYVNGKPIDSVNTAFGIKDTSQPMLVGRDSTARHFIGSISDAMTWNRALSPAEIQSLADPSNVMLDGLIRENYVRTLWPGIAPPIGGGSAFTIAGTSAVSGLAESTAEATATIAGTSVVTGLAESTAASSFSIAGTSAVAGLAESTAESSTSIEGTSVVTGLAGGASTASFTIAGTSTVSGTGELLAEAVAAIVGQATVTGVGSSTQAGSTFTISGTSAVSGLGASTAASVFAIAGTSSVIGLSPVTVTISERFKILGANTKNFKIIGSQESAFKITGA